MPRAIPTLWVLGGIGLVGGFFSALFGVGGGLIVVPLLIMFAGFGSHAATGTSLVVIGFTAVVGAAAFASIGEVHWREAAVVGIPAMAGAFLGTWLQQHVNSRLLAYLFAVFVFAVAVTLFFE
ncbi:MAG TPA: sulfite exporter TauE/SafE family protein [Gaiellaceae bacterium]|nr:sulfite exporter TauE/SafE family protein [Gaiellaceae bacterium]